MGQQEDKIKKKNRFSRSSSRSENPYLGLLLKIYRFLERRTHSKFNRVVLTRLFKSRTHQSPVSLSRLIKYSKGRKNKTFVVVGKVLNDERIGEIPPISVCALKFSSVVRNRIEKAGGEVLTFDQVALRSPTGKNTILVRGPKKKINQKKKIEKKDK